MEGQRFLNIESAIKRFVTGQASPEDKKLIYDWIQENPDKKGLLFSKKDIWESSRLGTKEIQKIENAEWLDLQSKINSSEASSFNFYKNFKIAAIVILSVGIGWFSRFFYSDHEFPNEVALQKVSATKGQIKEVFLADGTHVWLNSDSEILFPGRFSKNNRTVKLEGEAFFEVTANEEKPFLIKTKNHTVKVVGTRFNICEYPESNIIETTLEKGKVKILSGNIIKDLFPGEQLSFNTETSEVRISKVDLEIYTTWKDGRYVFNDEPIDKIFTIIERWWDVKIDYPEKMKSERITGVLRKYKPVEQHLQVIKQLTAIDYQINNDQILVTLNK